VPDPTTQRRSRRSGWPTAWSSGSATRRPGCGTGSPAAAATGTRSSGSAPP